MRTALMLFLIVFGILAIPAVPLLGVGMVGTGLWVGARVTHDDTSQLLGLLLLLGAIGFVASFFVAP